MIFLAECTRNSCYVNRWSSERRGQTCLDYAESRQRKTKSTDGAARGEAEFTQTIPKYRANESKAKPSGQA